MATKRTPINVFLPAYLKAVEEGLTKEEFAAQMGIKPSTVYQRVYEMRRAGFSGEIPLMKSAGKVPLKDRIKAILEGQKAPAKPAKAKAKAKPEGKAEPDAKVDEPESADQDETLANIFG